MLSEGVKKLNKQFIHKLQNRSDIHVGIEYEFHYDKMQPISEVAFSIEPKREDTIYELFKLVKSYDLVDSDNVLDIWHEDCTVINSSEELFQFILEEGHIDIDDEDAEKLVDTFNFYVECVLNGFLDADNKSDVINKVLEENSFDIYDCDMLSGREEVNKYTNLLMNIYESGYDIDENYEIYVDDLMSSNVAYNLIESKEDGVYDESLLEELEEVLTNIISSDVKLNNRITVYDNLPFPLEHLSEEVLEYMLSSTVIDDYLYYDYQIIEFDGSEESFEYFEFDEEEGVMAVQSDLENERIDFYKVETDNDNQVEVISETMTLSDALENIDEMLDYIGNNGWTNDKSGMHVSISSDKWKNTPFNVLKFFTLLNVDYLVKDIFPPRTHVGDLFDIYISDRKKALIHDYLINEPSLSTAISKLFKMMEADAKKQMSGKFQSIKFDDYETMNGRIELRYFGGEGYESRDDEIKKKIYEAIYVMELSYGDLFDREYKKSFIKLLNTIVDRFSEFNTVEEYHKYLNE